MDRDEMYISKIAIQENNFCSSTHAALSTTSGPIRLPQHMYPKEEDERDTA
jgi:hypothetical protein